MARDRFIQYGFRISTDLLDAVRKRTANVSEYLRSLIENDLGQDADLREYPRTPYVYHAKLTEVIDGDTLKLELDVGFEITLHATIRLEQINAPEIDTAAGKRAKAFLQKKLKGAYLVIETKKRGKYGRYIARVF
jgi:endonuclease YncB( thermonuclease family)